MPGSSTAPSSGPKFPALLQHAPVGFLEYIFEHFGYRRFGFAQCAHRLPFLDRGANGLSNLRLELDMAFFIPFTDPDQMLLQTFDGIAQRPELGFIGGPITGGIVAGGMASSA